jgi:predicted site-specific integrase-resolvase
MNVEQSVSKALEGVEFISPYRLAKVLQSLRGREVKPQMVYNYIKKGYIKGSTNSTGKHQVSKVEAEKFLTKQLTPKVEVEV